MLNLKKAGIDLNFQQNPRASSACVSVGFKVKGLNWFVLNKLLIVWPSPSKIPLKELAKVVPIGTNPVPEFQLVVDVASILLFNLYELEVAVFIPCKPYTS